MWAALDWPILTSEQPGKGRSSIVEVQCGQSLWDSLGERALVHGTAECESSYDVGPLLFPSFLSEPLLQAFMTSMDLH